VSDIPRTRPLEMNRMAKMQRPSTSDFLRAVIEKRDALRERSAAAQAKLSTARQDAERARIELASYTGPGINEKKRRNLEHDANPRNFVIRCLEEDLERLGSQIVGLNWFAQAGPRRVQALADLAAAKQAMQHARDEDSRWQSARSGLTLEIEQLEAERSRIVKAMGAAELSARLGRAPASLTDTYLRDVDDRLGTLRSAIAASEDPAQQREQALKEAQRNLEAAYRAHMVACRALAEIEYYEQLPSLLPALARLVATGSDIVTALPEGSSFRIDVAIGGDELAAAEKEVANEAEAA
jgi:hypothetical protein